MSFLIPISIIIPLALVIIILIVVMWYLYDRNKEIASKLISERIRFKKYKAGVQTLKNNPTEPIKDFEVLNQYVRAFFKEYLNLDFSLTYLELEENFKKQSKPEYADFCRLMSIINYTGEKTNASQTKEVIEKFAKIIEEY